MSLRPRRARRAHLDPAPSAEDRRASRARLEAWRDGGWVLPPSLRRDDVVPTWTRLGVLDGERTALVDSRGLVTPHRGPEAVSLDWWIGAEDGWHAAATATGVTQRRIDGAPVVETVLRVPGGQIVHRAHAARGPAHPGGDSWIVVEVENQTPVPVVLAWVLRPWTAAELTAPGPLGLERTAAAAPNGPHLLVAGAPVGVVRRPPSRWADDRDGTDPWAVVTAEAASTGAPPAPDPAISSLALLSPLPGAATGRVALFGAPADPAADRSGLGWPDDLPDAATVARGWSTLAARGPRIELPDPVLADAVAAARRSVPLSVLVHRRRAGSDAAPPDHDRTVTAGDGGPGSPDSARDVMDIVAATAWWSDPDGAARILTRWPERQQRGGGFGSVAATAAALRALAAHVVADGDIGPTSHWLPEVGGAVEFLERSVRKGASPEETLDAVVGMRAGALVVTAVGQPDPAAEIETRAAALEAEAGPLVTVEDTPATPPRRWADAAGRATAAGAPAWALWSLLRRATPTWTWSDPDRWTGDDGAVPARLLTAAAQLLVHDRADGVAVTPWMPPDWWGQGWELHGAPTRWGRLSYAIRWHSGRPALLWEIDPAVPGGPWLTAAFRITAPGLDPAWSSAERRGEALLAAVAPPPEVGAEPPAPTGGAAIAAPPRSVWRPQDPGPDSPPRAAADPPRRSDAPAGEPDGGSFS